jgi:hypothetical protein
VKALSIRQPWCWFILADFPWQKCYENRNWDESYLRAQLSLCPVGSDFLIHASKGMTQAEFDEACAFAVRAGANLTPRFDDLKRGGIVGIVRLDGVVKEVESPWFTGPIALRLKAAYPLPFVPCNGALGFFDFAPLPVERGEALA